MQETNNTIKTTTQTSYFNFWMENSIIREKEKTLACTSHRYGYAKLKSGKEKKNVLHVIFFFVQISKMI